MKKTSTPKAQNKLATHYTILLVTQVKQLCEILKKLYREKKYCDFGMQIEITLA